MSTEEQPISLTIRNAVAHICLNRPDRLNALNPDMLALLHRAIEDAPGQGARAIVLHGQGRAFCAGADLKSGGGGDAGAKLRADYHPVVSALHNAPIPVVAAVQGVAAGGGAGLALSADITVMEQDASLAFVFANIGLVPDLGAAWLVAQSVGRARALDLLLLGQTLSAEQARAEGLITRIAPTGEGHATATALAEQLATMPTVALGMIREQVSRSLPVSFEAALDLEATCQTHASATDDYKEAIAAFREKRKPVFSGC